MSQIFEKPQKWYFEASHVKVLGCLHEKRKKKMNISDFDSFRLATFYNSLILDTMITIIIVIILLNAYVYTQY